MRQFMHLPLQSSIERGGPVLTKLAYVLLIGFLSGCASEQNFRVTNVDSAIKAEIKQEASVVKPVTVVENAVSVAVPVAAPTKPMRISYTLAEPKLDLIVNNASAREVFLAIVSDTRYSMLMHPDVTGNISVTLRSVTVVEALESLKDVYGYDYKIEGKRITVFAPSIQTRMFIINYPQSQRNGSSALRVSSGAQTQSNQNSNAGQSTNNSASAPVQMDGSRVSTHTKSNFWEELTTSVQSIVGTGKDRSVISSPQSGVMAVRAMPDELKHVEQFLKAAQVSVERQVMLEAKIVEVELSDGYQSGVDWSGLKNGGGVTGAMGSISGGNPNNMLNSGVLGNIAGLPGSAASLLSNTVSIPAAANGVFGLALSTDGFQAVLGFLETRGNTQILSSPRIATLNNQKAVLKVGTDAYFVTGVSGGTTTPGATASTTTSTLPTIALSSFFSGIALDVTPQIDDANTITLHVHTSVTQVTEKSKQIDLGTLGNYKFPMASSNVNESDTVVRLQDGKIVAIGGLMQVESNQNASGLPGSADVPLLGSVLGNKAKNARKKEVVVLLKPTIIRSAQDWDDQTQKSRDRLDSLEESRVRVITINGDKTTIKP